MLLKHHHCLKIISPVDIITIFYTR